MVVKLKIKSLLPLLLIFILGVHGCTLPAAGGAEVRQGTPAIGDVPTWTLRPQDLTQTALQTATLPASVSSATPVPKTATLTPPIEATPKTVRVKIKGGNLFVHRGPSLDYNYVDVLYDGQTVLATGRDRISRWIRIVLPSDPYKEGWITTETDYTVIDGDIPNLPYVEVEAARPAYIRNCTKHELWIYPPGVKLLDKFESPYNEERFSVGVYQVYDAENQEDKPIEEVDLSEGETIDIRYDWTGERSKCE